MRFSDLNDNNENENRDRKWDDLIFELIKKRLDSEGERTTSLDSNAGNFVGFVSVGLLLGALWRSHLRYFGFFFESLTRRSIVCWRRMPPSAASESR